MQVSASKRLCRRLARGDEPAERYSHDPIRAAVVAPASLLRCRASVAREVAADRGTAC
jgi:hypothetical protein